MRIFITGATGYMGQALARTLVTRGHDVDCLTRPESRAKVPAGCHVYTGNVLDSRSFAERLRPEHTLVHLVGVSHPSPAKSRQFREIDLASLRESVHAAKEAGVRHFVFVSVAQPAPVMKDYVEVRRECERLICASGLSATVLRPWYVLGPGHWWPLLLMPFYTVAEWIPPFRETARRLGLVSRKQMLAALLDTIEETQTGGVRIIDVPGIRSIAARGKTNRSAARYAVP